MRCQRSSEIHQCFSGRQVEWQVQKWLASRLMNKIQNGGRLEVYISIRICSVSRSRCILGQIPLARPGPDQTRPDQTKLVGDLRPRSATSPVTDPSQTCARPGLGQVADINHVIDLTWKTKKMTTSLQPDKISVHVETERTRSATRKTQKVCDWSETCRRPSGPVADQVADQVCNKSR
jgi:hypothetical protein